ncbi:hypothetical protein CLV56_3627 [Mumia flava]|uniref:Uncharacterized protein n=1 Tax=Mumia flava TaxID=1348852 RepID=A0A0B2B2H5_9ACTN|nr:hypothetical protein [Mumia flava]PJJ54123.1 hypothetical protein CLV56_3627 [Mumia flava]
MSRRAVRPDSVVIRPRSGAGSSSLMRGVVLVLVANSAGVVMLSLSGGFAIWLLNLGLLAIGIGRIVTVLWSRTTRVRAVPGSLRVTRWASPPILIATGTARGLLGRDPATKRPVLIVMSADGRRVRLGSDTWDEQDLRTVAELGEFDEDPTVVRTEEWEARLPGSTTWLERHPLGGLEMTMALVAATITLATAIGATG